MLLAAMSPSTTISEEGSVSSDQRAHDGSSSVNPLLPISVHTQLAAQKPKKKRNQPGNPDPDAEVVALSPRTLMATNRYVCDLCGKGFQRDQNLQLHRRGHNLPWKLRQRDGKAPPPRKKVYVCPDVTCAHHDPSRALGDLTGIKKHFSRKHGEKKWSCERCSKSYAVLSDYKAHAKTCGTREYKCGCGTVFSRKDSFATHRAFCDALAEETARLAAARATGAAAADTATDAYTPFIEEPQEQQTHQYSPQYFPSWDRLQNTNPNPILALPQVKFEDQPLLLQNPIPTVCAAAATASHLSATTLLQRAAAGGHLANASGSSGCATAFCGRGGAGFDVGGDLPAWQRGDCSLLTRNFLGVAGEEEEVLLSLTSGFSGGSGIDCMGPPTAASGDCLGGTSAGETPEAAVGFGFPTVATTASASPSWWRMLE